jgi:hypothetical protein
MSAALRSTTAILVAALLCVSGALFVSALRPAAALAAPDPLTCAGYPGPRVFLEAQSWWTQAPGQMDQHLHMGTCFPLNQTVSGVVSFDVRLMKHGALGRTIFFRIHDDLGTECHRSHPEVSNTDPNGMVITHVEVDTSCFRDGYRAIFFNWTVKQPNGNRFIVRQNIPVDIENGKADLNWRANTLMGGSSFEEPRLRDWNYANSLILGGQGKASAYSVEPRAGEFSLRLKTTQPPRADITERSFVATVDPDFHNGNPGTEVLRTDGGYQGPLSIDSTALANGAHRLVLIECQEVASEGKVLCGVLAVPFVVQN